MLWTSLYKNKLNRINWSSAQSVGRGGAEDIDGFHVKCFFKWANPGLFFVYFWSFLKKYNFYNKSMWKNVHPLYGAEIQTQAFRTCDITHNH